MIIVIKCKMWSNVFCSITHMDNSDIDLWKKNQKQYNLVFQNEEIFVKLDKLDRITHDWIALSHNHIQQFGVMVKVPDS